MSIALGGKVYQNIQPDKHKHQWDAHKTRCFHVQILSHTGYREVVGMDPPESPITLATYASERKTYDGEWTKKPRIEGKFTSITPVEHIDFLATSIFNRASKDDAPPEFFTDDGFVPDVQPTYQSS